MMKFFKVQYLDVYNQLHNVNTIDSDISEVLSHLIRDCDRNVLIQEFNESTELTYYIKKGKSSSETRQNISTVLEQEFGILLDSIAWEENWVNEDNVILLHALALFKVNIFLF